MASLPMVYCSTPGCAQRVPRGHCATHRPRAAARPNADVRRWYGTARWRRLRAIVQHAQPCCDDCTREGHTVPGTDVDHTRPHRGDAALFFDRGNLTNKCKAHHALKTRRGE